MSIRKVVHIDEELCTGCGACVPSCAEGAIQVIDGKARLVADRLCDGLGACLGECPEGALTVEEREADAFDEVAVENHLVQQQKAAPSESEPNPVHHGHAHGFTGGCPGSRVMQFKAPSDAEPQSPAAPSLQPSELRQWPIQLHLVPPTAPYYEGADVLLAADCTAFVLGGFHANFLKGRSLAIACPKLDQGMEIYREKLTAMIDKAKINTLTVLIMQVPCCSGLLHIALEASSNASRKVPIKRVVVGVKGEILSEEWV